MGMDKAALLLDGVPLLERVLMRVSAVAASVVVVGGAPRLSARGIPTLPDLYPGANAMGGIATALNYAAQSLGPDVPVLCTACDVPFLEPALLAHLWEVSPGWDVVVPRVTEGYEPLCALYRGTCLVAFEEEMARGNLAIRDVFRRVRTREVLEPELRRFDPELRSFVNLNRPTDLEVARRLLSGVA
jgi:molybdopterin-guanine dinucleotide biosynthesis protein A